MCCEEKAKRRRRRRRARARCWEVQVTWWAPGPCGGGSALPLSYIYPLAAVRQAGWVDRGRWGGAGAPREREGKWDEWAGERNVALNLNVRSELGWAARRSLLPAAYKHASVSRVKYCDLWLFPLSPFINVIQIGGKAAWHAHTRAERISLTHWWDSEGFWQNPLFPLCCCCTLLLCSCRSHSFYTEMELSVDCFQLFMFCLWAHVIRTEIGNLPSSCAIKTERALISGLLVESHISAMHTYTHTLCEEIVRRVEATETMERRRVR